MRMRSRARAVARRDALRFRLPAPPATSATCSPTRYSAATRQAVLSLLKTHADVNAPQSDGATALHWAAYLEDADTTALLIRAGAKRRYAQQLRRDPAGAGRRKRQRRGHRSAVERRRRSERRRARGRDAADARGAHRKRGRGEGAAERRRNGRREGNLERTNGADVGGGRGARPGRASADRSPAPTSARAPTAARRLSCLRCGAATWLPSARCWRRARTSRRRDLTARRRCSSR